MGALIGARALPPDAAGRWRALALMAGAIAALGAGGCSTLRGAHSSVVVATPSTPAAAAPAPASASGAPSLAAIGSQLQSGHYAEGEKALRQHLERHPGDRAARAMLRQLTADPRQELGERWRAHVVQPGDSYSTLAARYLGDPNLFLILARYNGSTNPSMLRVGEALRMPLSAAAEAAPAAGETTLPTAVVRPDEPPATAARRLQDESVSLLGQGHRQRALARLDQALSIDPGLKPAGTGAAALRKQLLDSYHERAIVLYRDQQLDQAIALWDRILAIAPDYEPAIVYRTRARELKQRLMQY